MSLGRPLEQFGTGRKGNTALILSGVAASLRETAAESKDPCGYFCGRHLSFDFQPTAKANPPYAMCISIYRGPSIHLIVRKADDQIQSG